MRLVFLMSIFAVRRYDGAFLSSAHVACSMKFSAFTNESVNVNKFSVNTEVLRSYLKLEEKVIVSNYLFWIKLNIIHQGFQGSNLVQFRILRMLCYTPKVI